MTKGRGDTPKIGVHRQSKESSAIENRVFGVEVICGDIEFKMTCSVNQLQMGGANLAIEVQRLALEKLSEELEQYTVPNAKELIFQFDNCGENKVI